MASTAGLRILRGLSLAFAAIWLAFGVPQWLLGATRVAAMWNDPSVSTTAADMLARAGGLYMTQMGVAQLAISLWAPERALRLFLWVDVAQCLIALFHWAYWVLPNERVMAGFPPHAATGILLSWAAPAALLVFALLLIKPTPAVRG